MADLRGRHGRRGALLLFFVCLLLCVVAVIHLQPEGAAWLAKWSAARQPIPRTGLPSVPATADPMNDVEYEREDDQLVPSTLRTRAAEPLGHSSEHRLGQAQRAVSAVAASLGSCKVKQPLLPPLVVERLCATDNMIDLEKSDINENCSPWPERESTSNVRFMEAFGRIFKHQFDNLPWWLDEGGLIGSGRAGSMVSADDDFDFFALLPSQHAPCRADSLTCTPEEFHEYIHSFLMVFWDAGMCINKFHPNKDLFVDRRRLMYSFQLDRRAGVPPEKCFVESKPFAHMHLGIFTEDTGELQTNIWAHGTTHPMDRLPLDLIFPIRRCRAGPVDAPCPNNITGFLSIRNRGEYRKKSSDGSCLLVRKKWGESRKMAAVERVRMLDKCGYNSMVDLVDEFVKSGYARC